MIHGMNTFDEALRFVLAAEGGYVNDPLDRGGETNFGISKRAYPTLDIKNLTEYEASNIYYRDYWLHCQCDKLPPQFAIAVFGSAVNHGPTRAIRLLQQTIKSVDDGIMGPATLAAAGANNNRYMLGRFLSFRAKYYLSIVTRKPSQTKFYGGWMQRLFDLQQFILEVTHAD